jgi:serine/threonine protein phosphatase PrpC
MADPLPPESEGNSLLDQETPDIPIVPAQKEVIQIQIEGSSTPPEELGSSNPLPLSSPEGVQKLVDGAAGGEAVLAGYPEDSSGDSEGEQPTNPPAPPKPAAWEVKEPTEKWWPETLENELGLGLDYKHELQYSSNYGSDWIVAAATKRGRMHAHHGTYREDALWGAVDDNYTFYCVCDGAGSSKLSRIGSEYTARKLSEFVKKELKSHEIDILKCSKESLPNNLRSILYHCLDSVQRELLDLATKDGMQPKDFRCTVLTTLHYRHPTGGIILCGNVGDGFLAVKCKGQPTTRIGTSDSGAFSGEVTCFMPDPEVAQYYKKSLEENTPIPDDDVEAYMLCTDGIEDPFFPIHRTVDEIYLQLLEGYKEPLKDVTYPRGSEPSSVIRSKEPGVELLKWLSFEKRGENDDRTIALIYRSGLGENSVAEIAGDQEALLEDKGTAVQPDSTNKSSSVRDTVNLRVLQAMIIGGLLVASAFILGMIIGLKIGSSSGMSSLSR